MRLKPNKTQFLTGDLSCPPDKAAYFVLPVPYEKTTSYKKGTAKGPAAIIEASMQLELYDEETGAQTHEKGIFTLSPFRAAGDGFFGGLEKFVSGLIEKYRAIPFFLGGEHSISQALIPPFAKKFPDLSVLHFDAHADLRETYEGSRRNHACAMHPISGICKIVQIGIRNIAPEERNLVNSENVRTFLMHENPCPGKLANHLRRILGKNVYLSIDVDGFDPSVIPGTGTPQPGGFGWYDALEIFRKIIHGKNIVGVDIVETRPLKENPVSEFTAAKLAYRLMSYISAR